MQPQPISDAHHHATVERWSKEMRGVNVAPTKRLMLAVLQEAVLTLIDLPPRVSLQRRRLIVEAESWVASRNRAHPFAFAAICEALNLDVECLRRSIDEWRTEARRAISSQRK